MITENTIAQEQAPILHITPKVAAAIFEHIATRPAESGGALGRKEGADEISYFAFDEGGAVSSVTYTPDHVALTRLFEDDWNPKGIYFEGMVHSHPDGHDHPSEGDRVYAERILEANPSKALLWLPIVNTLPDTGEFKLTPWAVVRGERGAVIARGRIRLRGDLESLSSLARSHGLEFDADKGPCTDDVTYWDEIRFTKTPKIGNTSPDTERIDQEPDAAEPVPLDGEGYARTDQTFARVVDAYDLDRMANSRIIAAGAGGAASWLEELARAGMLQFILVDPDIVSETNLATQQVYRRDIGRPKVDCIAERIRDINPLAKTVCLQKRIEDIPEEQWRRYAMEPLDGYETRQTLICGFTDNFFAQAHVNLLALKFGLPSLCAQLYRQGMAAEITFTYPGITPACHRCILSSRYKYYLQDGMDNDVTSHGTPIFATTRLNAIKGFVALALLHHGSNHPRWGTMLERTGKRNLLLVRMDPSAGSILGLPQFSQAFDNADPQRVFFDETVWLPEEQESPETGYDVACPDCGGTGDLRNAIGKTDVTSLFTPIITAHKAVASHNAPA